MKNLFRLTSITMVVFLTGCYLSIPDWIIYSGGWKLDEDFSYYVCTRYVCDKKNVFDWYELSPDSKSIEVNISRDKFNHKNDEGKTLGIHSSGYFDKYKDKKIILHIRTESYKEERFFQIKLYSKLDGKYFPHSIIGIVEKSNNALHFHAYSAFNAMRGKKVFKKIAENNGLVINKELDFELIYEFGFYEKNGNLDIDNAEDLAKWKFLAESKPVLSLHYKKKPPPPKIIPPPPEPQGVEFKGLGIFSDAYLGQYD